ncbi:hypothetical protein IC229_10820 [Spirosoma sp. BT702]|uniref:Uncharacterized protein n=1 Tax=Spirosoma profusum TaxID=2771354 RepID=A0A927AN52_9BACT|nr:hypothetical protein [Spirosoma profusum]MBD2701129.1 hypothetical protein [Spirosoma profusum]
MNKTLLCCLGFWLVSISIKAQSQIDMLLDNEDFKPVLQEHLWTVRGLNFPNTSVILLQPQKNGLTAYLTVYTFLTEAQKHLPASFTTVQGQPFLIYDGSELKVEDKERWFETVRTFIGKHLCDDVEFFELLKKPGPKEIRSPCSVIYDAPIEQLTFVKGKLKKRQLVGKVPYYQ